MSNYKRIIESFNPYTKTNEGYFDKDTREKRRAERKENRAEKKFNKGGAEEDSLVTGKFKINAYIKAITSLKNDIIATLGDVDQHIKTTPELGTYKEKFKKDLIRAARVLGEISYLKTKEGNTLENDEDQELIKGYRDVYNSLKNDYEGDSESYRKERDELIIKSLKELKFSEISDPIKQASALFNEATELLAIFNDNLSRGVIGDTTVAKDDVKKDDDKKTQSSLKIKASIAKGARKNDEVKTFQQLLIDKFAKNKDLVATTTWKAFAKYGADGNFGNGTANVILLFKKLYKLDDKTSSITQELIDKISAEAVKESLLLSFNSFLNKQKGILEEFSAADIEAAETFVTKKAPVSDTSSSDKSSSEKTVKAVVPELDPSPFSDKASGDAFRKWVNENKPDLAKKYDLDLTGPFNNSTIRKVWTEIKGDSALIKWVTELSKKSETPVGVKLDGKAIGELQKKMEKAKNTNARILLQKVASGTGEDVIYYEFDKTNNTRFGHFYSNGRVSYKTSSGKTYWGNYDPKTDKVKFDNGKTFNLGDVVKMKCNNALMGGVDSEKAQKKDVYLSKGLEYVNVRTSTATNTSANNIIYKHKNKAKKIGFILSTKVVKSERLGNKTWYKVQFPSEIEEEESGWVRADTVDLK